MLVTLTGFLFLLTIYYHFFHHLNVQKCCQHHPPIQVRYLLYISVSNTVAHPKSKVLPSYVIIFIKFLFSTRGSISLNGCNRLQFLKKQSYFGWNSFYLSKKNILNQTWKSFNTKSRPQWENSIFIFQEFFARIYKIFISEERLDTRL